MSSSPESASALHISVEAEKLFEIAGFPLTNSFIVSLIISFLFIILAFWYWREQKQKKPNKLKIFIDMILEGLLGFFEGVAGKKARKFFPLLATFFLYIMFCNWSGLLPGMGSILLNLQTHGKIHSVHLLRGPTADLNATVAFAIISVVMAQVWGIRYLGLGAHLKKFFNFSNPIMLFIGLLELASEFSKIISYSFRLFGNIFAGEVLLSVMGFIVPYGLLAPLPFLGLEIFVGFIQALVFTMLSLVFWTIATQSHEEHKNHNNNKNQ